MKKSLFKGKSTRTKIFTAITAAGILLLLVLNLLITNLGLKNLLFIDMTPEGLYQLSDRMEGVCDELLCDLPEGRNIRITFCSDPDTMIDYMYVRVVYFMALAMQLRYDNVEVKTCNVRYDPTAVSMYKTTSRSEIEPTDVIISYGQKYRIINCESFWTQSGGELYSFNGEYKLASALASLTAIKLPKAYFLTDHGESYYDPENPDSEMSIENAAFADLITDIGMEIKTAKISDWERVPEDCAMLIINLPTKDFLADGDKFNSLSYTSDIEKIEKYLINGGGTLVVNKNYDCKLPNFETFLEAWGISFSDSYVVDGENSLVTGEDKTFAAEYDSSEESYGYNFYMDYVALSSAPKMVFSDTGYLYCSYGDGGTSRAEDGYMNVSRRFAPFIGSYDTATSQRDNGGSVEITDEAGYKALAAISARTSLDSASGEKSYSYIFASASEKFFSNEILENHSYANRDLLTSVLINISRTDRYVSTDLGGLSGNSLSFGGKTLTTTELSAEKHTVYENVYSSEGKAYEGLTKGATYFYLVLVLVPAAAALVLGAVVYIRRKFL